MSEKTPSAPQLRPFVLAVYFFVPSKTNECMITTVTLLAFDMEHAKELGRKFNTVLQSPPGSKKYQLSDGTPVVLWKITVSEVPPEFTFSDPLVGEVNPFSKPKKRRGAKKKPGAGNVVLLFPEGKKSPDDDPSAPPPKPPEKPSSDDPPKSK